MIAPPAVQPGDDIRDALGLERSVAFHLEPGTLDVPFDDGHLSEAAAIRRAVETSAELQAALARVHVAAMEAELTGRLPNPVLSLVLRDPMGSGSTQVEAVLTESLLGLLKRPERAATAGHRLQAEAAAALSTALDVVADVQTRYAECQVLEELVPVLERRLAAYDRLVGVAAPPLERLTLASQRTELSIAIGRRQQDARVARLALARRIGEPSGAAAWTLQPWSRPPAVATDEAPWLEAALSSRPEVAAADWELRARQEEEELASGVPWEGATVGVDAEKDDDDDDDGWSVGPTAKAPLAIFDTPGERREQAQMHTAEARHRLTAARRAVVEDVRSALAVLAAAQESLGRVESELIPAQERRQAEVEEVWRGGTLDLTSVLLAVEGLGRAQEARLELEREVSAALFRLQRAVGGPVRFRDLQ